MGQSYGGQRVLACVVAPRSHLQVGDDHNRSLPGAPQIKTARTIATLRRKSGSSAGLSTEFNCIFWEDGEFRKFCQAPATACQAGFLLLPFSAAGPLPQEITRCGERNDLTHAFPFCGPPSGRFLRLIFPSARKLPGLAYSFLIPFCNFFT